MLSLCELAVSITAPSVSFPFHPVPSQLPHPPRTPLLTGPAPDLDDLFQLSSPGNDSFEGGLQAPNSNGNGTYLAAAAAPLQNGIPHAGAPLDDSSIWGWAHEHLPFEAKVEQLLGAFEVSLGCDCSMQVHLVEQLLGELEVNFGF